MDDEGYDGETFIDKADVWIGDEIVTKEDCAADVSKRFLYMLQTFYQGGKMMSQGNDFMIKMYFHSVMGAYLKDYTITKTNGVIDLRVPLIMVQGSGSGKSQMNKYSLDICNKIGMKACQQSEFSGAGLTGSFDKGKHDYNIKNNLRPGDDISFTDPKTGAMRNKRYQSPVNYGDLYYFDMIFIDEGKVLFIGNKHTEGVLSAIQPALDYPGKVRKKLAGDEPIEYDCSCTLVTTTVEWSGLTPDIMEQGFFSRHLFHIRKMSIDDYDMQIHLRNGIIFDIDEYHRRLDDFAWGIEKHPIPLTRERHRINVEPQCLETIEAAQHAWIRQVKEKLYGREVNTACAFISRMDGFIYKIAGQMAVLNHRLNPKIKNDTVYLVGQDEVEYALGILNPLFDIIMRSLSVDDSRVDNKYLTTTYAIMNRMRERDVMEMPKNDVMAIIRASTYTGGQKSLKYYANLLSGNFISEHKDQNGTIITKPNWELWKDERKAQGGKRK